VQTRSAHSSIGKPRATDSVLVRTLWLAVVLMVGAPAPTVLAADESVLLERPSTKSVREDKGPLDRSFEEPPPRDPVLAPETRRALEDLPAFLSDTELAVDFRTYYFRRRFANNQDAEAWAIGGALSYRSGWLLDRLQLGATLFTSQKLYGPKDRDGTRLLRPGQRSYTVVGESFIRLRERDHELTVYRHRLALPYVNGNDGRMTPNTFEGATLIGRHAHVAYAGGHLLQMKRRNDDHFV
jgi:hypothetical protein